MPFRPLAVRPALATVLSLLAAELQSVMQLCGVTTLAQLRENGKSYHIHHPFNVMLNTGKATPGERRSLQRELCIRTSQHVRLDPIELVPAQEEALREWLPIAQRVSTKPGYWTRPFR